MKYDDNAHKIVTLPVTLGDGQTHQVACTFGIIVRYELMTGINLMETRGKGMGALAIVQFLACAIYETNEEALENLAALQNKISGKHLKKIKDIINAIFDHAADEGETEQEKKSASSVANQNGIPAKTAQTNQ